MHCAGVWGVLAALTRHRPQRLVPGLVPDRFPSSPRLVPPGDAGSEDAAGAEEAAVCHRPLSGVQAPKDPGLCRSGSGTCGLCRAPGVLGQGWQWVLGQEQQRFCPLRDLKIRICRNEPKVLL